MNIYKVISLLLLVFSTITNAGILKPFTSDGCSSFPNGTLTQKKLWLSCCTIHDKAYWKGGTYQEKLDADKALRACVSNIGQPEIGEVMFIGVSIGGLPLWPTSFRWGYGWPYPTFYRPLTEQEQAQVRAMELKSESNK